MSFEMKYDMNGDSVKLADAPKMPVSDRLRTELEVVGGEPLVEQEAAAPEVEQEYDHDHVEDVVEEAPLPKASATNTANIRSLRERAERAERAERERDEALNYIREMKARQEYKPEPVEEPEEDYSISLRDDELAEGKHLSKMQKKIAALENMLKKTQQQSSRSTVETRLKMQYSDIEQVLSASNLEALRDADPELAYTISMNPDFYSQSVTAYKQIKKMGIHKDPNAFDEEKQTIQKNTAKPRPAVSINAQKGDSPLSRANAFAGGLTEDLKKQLQKEMADIRRNT